MSDRITVAGRVGKDPDQRTTKSGELWLSFRLASTPRIRDEQGRWSDGETSWYSVNAYGALARNAADSLHHGERVLVTGDLTVRSWTNGEGRTVLTPTIRAAAIGHDLTFGTTTLARSGRRTDPPSAEEQGAPEETPAAPVDRSDEWPTPMSDGGPAESYLPDEEPSWASAG
jgi:single-strand DNA-binding protein